MPWFKVDDGLHSSKKLMAIPRRHRLASIGLWTIAGSWSADQLEDGIIPDYMVEEWGGTKVVVDCLVVAGLWERGQGSVAFRNWAEYQPTKQDVEREREAARERMRAARARRKGVKDDEQRDAGDGSPEQAPNTARSSEEVRESFDNPDPVPVPTPSPIPTPKREAPQASPAAKRGQRIPDSWTPSDELFQAMAEECPHVDQQLEHRTFMDHWKSQPGAKGVKLDWEATYRNWIRRSSKNAPRSANRATDRMRAGYDAMATYQGPTEDPWARKEIGA